MERKEVQFTQLQLISIIIIPQAAVVSLAVAAVSLIQKVTAVVVVAVAVALAACHIVHSTDSFARLVPAHEQWQKQQVQGDGRRRATFTNFKPKLFNFKFELCNFKLEPKLQLQQHVSPAAPAVRQQR
eukprot:11515-Heterococcus_DN1.PRE.1